MAKKDMILTSEVGTKIANYLVSIYGAMLIILGTIGNVGFGSIILRDRRRIKSKIRFLFILLVITDTLVLWFKTLRYWVRTTFTGVDLRKNNLIICRAHVFLVYMTSNLAILIFGVLCLDRSIVICNNLRSIQLNLRPVIANIPNKKQVKFNQNRLSLVRSNSTNILTIDKQDIQGNRRTQIEQSRNSLEPLNSNNTGSSLSLPKCIEKLTNSWHRFQQRYTEQGSYVAYVFIFGICIILAKHLPFYNSLNIDNSKNCQPTKDGIIREYIEFATQTILPFIFIIPANIMVYRAIKKHQNTLIALNLSVCRGGSMYTGGIDLNKNKIPYTFKFTNGIQQNRSISMHVRNPISRENSLNDRKKLMNFHHQPSSMILTSSPQISNGHLFVFKTLIVLSFLNFGISFPGSIFCIMMENLRDDQSLNTLYDALLILSDTHFGASFYVLLFTVRGFRRRFLMNISRLGSKCASKPITTTDVQQSSRNL